MIQDQRNKGCHLVDIAHQLGVHPKTVSRALKRGGAPSGRRQRRDSKLEAFKPKIDELLGAGVWNGMVIYRELQALGYGGCYSSLTDYIRPKRVLRPSKATVRFETEPGQQMQQDWGQVETEIAGVRCKVSFAVNTLGFSRRCHGYAAPCQDAEHTYESVIRAFEWFGGSTDEVWVDNQKAAVIEHRVGQSVRFNPRFVDLASHYGFRPKACRPYRARTKGKVESGVKYVKGNFFARHRAFDSLDRLNRMLEHWLVNEADRRCHGTVKEIVADRFEREQPALNPLPPVRFDTAYLEPRQVAWDGYVEVRGNRYSVPHVYCGRSLMLRLSLDGTVQLLDGSEVIASHPLTPRAQGWATVPDHHRSLWQQTMQVECRDLSTYQEAAQWN